MEYWLNAKPADPAVFADQVAAVCQVYQQARSFTQQGGHVMSTDEKTGIQALERAAPTLPMKPGLVERPEYEYIRHGTQCLIANFNVATGEIIAPSISATRTEEDFAAHIAQTIAPDPEAPWLFIVDQLNIHQSETLEAVLKPSEFMIPGNFSGIPVRPNGRKIKGRISSDDDRFREKI